MFIKANSQSRGIVIYSDGSVSKDQSGYWFTVKHGFKTTNGDIGAQSHHLQTDH